MSYSHSNGRAGDHDQQHPSGLIRALINTGRQKGSSATPAPPISSPTPNRDYQIQGVVNKMNTTSLNQDQNHTPERPAQSSISQGGRQQQHGRNDSDQSNQSRNQGGNSQEQTFRPQAEPFKPSTQRNGSNQSLRSTTGQSSRDSLYTSPGYGGPPPPLGPNGQRHLRSFAARENLAQGIQMQAPTSVSSMSAQIQKRFSEFKQRIEAKSGVTDEAKVSLINDVSLLSQEFDAVQRSLQQEMDRLQEAKESYYRQLQKGREQVQTAMADRDRYGSDREALQRVIDELRVKLTKHNEELDQTNAKWKKIQLDLTLRIRVMDEQLNAKRALWLESNQESSAKREAMKSVLDPFTSSPIKHNTGFDDSGYLGNLENLPLAKLEGNAPLNEASLNQLDEANKNQWRRPLPAEPQTAKNESSSFRRGPNLNTPQPRPNPNFGPPPYANRSRGNHHNSPRTPPPSKALIMHMSEQDVATEYKAEFQAIYGMIEGWVITYCDTPSNEVDTNLHKTHPKMWDFMMNVTYPGARRDAHVHSLALLGDPKARYWFIMRATISYLVKEVISVPAWIGFNAVADSAINGSLGALNERGLAVDARQHHVDIIHRAIQTIVSNDNYNKFRSANLTKHSKALRDMFTPLLNAGCDRAKAGRDLGVLVCKAWDFSGKVFTSHLTFSILFPDLTSKFVAGTMIAKDQPDVNPVQLQINQTRLRLVITPVVTLRDDRGTTIKAKNLHNSFVLTMG